MEDNRHEWFRCIRTLIDARKRSPRDDYYTVRVQALSEVLVPYLLSAGFTYERKDGEPTATVTWEAMDGTVERDDEIKSLLKASPASRLGDPGTVNGVHIERSALCLESIRLRRPLQQQPCQRGGGVNMPDYRNLESFVLNFSQNILDPEDPENGDAIGTESYEWRFSTPGACHTIRDTEVFENALRRMTRLYGRHVLGSSGNDLGYYPEGFSEYTDSGEIDITAQARVVKQWRNIFIDELGVPAGEIVMRISTESFV